jgi:hypothetical protein
MMIKGRLPFLSDAGELAPVDVHDPLGELPVPTLDERVLFYLRAVHGNRDFTEEERSNARNVLLNSMAAEIAAQADQSPKREVPGRETAHAADRRKEAIRVAPIARRRTSILALTATLGLVLIVTGWNIGISLDVSPHRGGGYRAGKTGPPAPTDYLSSLALDSARPVGATCGADRITTQRGRCTRGFSQAATRAANIV